MPRDKVKLSFKVNLPYCHYRKNYYTKSLEPACLIVGHALKVGAL